MLIWDFLVWIFEKGLLIGFMMLVIVLAVCFLEFYPILKQRIRESHVLHAFKSVYIPTYKQTSIIIAPTMKEYHKKTARLFVFFSYLNALIVFVLFSIGCTAYASTGLMFIFLLLAAAHNKVQGQYEQVIWEAACNIPKEKKHGKLHIKKKA